MSCSLFSHCGLFWKARVAKSTIVVLPPKPYMDENVFRISDQNCKKKSCAVHETFFKYLEMEEEFYEYFIANHSSSLSA